MKLKDLPSENIDQNIHRAESQINHDHTLCAFMLRNLFKPHSDLLNMGAYLSKEGSTEVKHYLKQTKEYFNI